MFKFPPRPWKLGVRVKATAEIRGSQTSWSPPQREAKLSLPLHAESWSHQQPWALFHGCYLPAKWHLPFTSPKAEGCTGRSASMNKTAHSKEKDAFKSVLYYLLLSYRTQRLVWNERTFLWIMLEVLLKSNPQSINCTSYAKSSAKSGAQSWFNPNCFNIQSLGLRWQWEL